MIEVGSVFAVAQKLLEVPSAIVATGTVLSWINEKVFCGKLPTQEKLKQLEQGKADAAIIADLKNRLEFALEDKAELREELEKKVVELTQLLKQSGIEQPMFVQHQTHYGTGDIVGRDKNCGK